MTTIRWPDVLPRPGNRKLKHLKGASVWFEVYEVGFNTYAFLEPYHEEEVLSYLVVGNKRAVQIDTGMGIGNVKKEIERLTDLPVTVVNTHAHSDHVGDNHRFEEVWIFDQDAEVGRLKKGKGPADCAGLVGPGTFLEEKAPPSFNPAKYESLPSPVTRRLHDEEVVDLGGRTLTVFHTPSESPGHICLLDGREGILFSGDAVIPGMIYTDPSTPDGERHLESLERLVGLGDRVKRLCPGHNEAVVSPDLLVKARDAFRKVIAGDAAPDEDGKRWRMYRFDGFGVALPKFSAW
jgi:glyoxylase-like metal-dependent hydrolase (beta-lactamase superfamily II)